MFLKSATILAAAGISCVHAQVYACDSLTQPNYDSCDNVMALIDWNQGVTSGPQIADGFCEVFTEAGDVGNCVIAACNQRGDGATQPLNTFTGPTSYGLVKQWCKPVNAGGQSPADGSNIVKATNNPNYKPGSAAFRAALGKVESKVMTVDEFKAFEESNKQVSSESAKPRSNSLQKRASWLLYGSSKNIRQDGQRSRMSAVGGSGSTQSWSTEEGYSTGVTTSLEMGVDLFEIFTASVSVSVTQEYSVSYTYTLTFDPSGKCDADQSAVLYFYPLFDQYLGAFDDDTAKEYTIWIPVEGQNNYELDVECLG